MHIWNKTVCCKQYFLQPSNLFLPNLYKHSPLCVNPKKPLLAQGHLPADPIFVAGQFIGKGKETCLLDKITTYLYWKSHYLNRLKLAGQSTRRICPEKQTSAYGAGKKWPNSQSPFCSSFYHSVAGKSHPHCCESLCPRKRVLRILKQQWQQFRTEHLSGHHQKGTSNFWTIFLGNNTLRIQ